jgi:Fe-S-cluster-containing hydrogenase component 2
MFRIVLDPEKCVGCRVCEGICSLINEGESNPEKSRIKVIRTIDDCLLYSISVFCQQCDEPQCESVCPAHAISRNNGGVIMVDEEKCIGCKLCEMACPVGAISVDSTKHVALKCNQCASIGEPQCVKYCYPKALQLLPAESVGRAVARARAHKLLEMEKRA